MRSSALVLRYCGNKSCVCDLTAQQPSSPAPLSHLVVVAARSASRLSPEPVQETFLSQYLGGPLTIAPVPEVRIYLIVQW